MSSRRIELAVPPKGARYSWPTYRLTEAHVIAAVKAIHGSPMTPLEKRLAKWVAEYLLRARSSARVADWQLAEAARTASESEPRRRRQGVDTRKSARGTVHGPRR